MKSLKIVALAVCMALLVTIGWYQRARAIRLHDLSIDRTGGVGDEDIGCHRFVVADDAAGGAAGESVAPDGGDDERAFAQLVGARKGDRPVAGATGPLVAWIFERDHFHARPGRRRVTIAAEHPNGHGTAAE